MKAAGHTVELFGGRQSFSRVARELGYETFVVELNPEKGYTPDWNDVLSVPLEYLGHPNILWASPPCEGFSVANIGRSWNKVGPDQYEPKSDTARHGLVLMERTTDIIRAIEPDVWFIENPRGMMRKVIEPHLPPGSRRVTLTYCQYGDKRMKPTDIWTNAHWWVPRPPCKNGDTCHEPAPRGSRTGTAGLSGAAARSEIPRDLMLELFEQYHATPRP